MTVTLRNKEEKSERQRKKANESRAKKKGSEGNIEEGTEEGKEETRGRTNQKKRKTAEGITAAVQPMVRRRQREGQ
jgi:hypothetical protein